MEVFGEGMEPWNECWAQSFIFGERSFAKQEYFWNVLHAGRHLQLGMGVLRIPGTWKRRLRRKQRGKLAARGGPEQANALQSDVAVDVAGTHAPHRGGACVVQEEDGHEDQASERKQTHAVRDTDVDTRAVKPNPPVFGTPETVNRTLYIEMLFLHSKKYIDLRCKSRF